MYDELTARYSFACPTRGQSHVSLSAFRRVERLPGASHPAVFHVAFACGCGEEHAGLAAHDDLDWVPLGLEGGGRFHNLMTGRLDSAGSELADVAARRIQRGEWPWTFFCYPEERVRPVFPSAFCLLTPCDRAIGVAVRCPACASVSVNIVSPEHVDLPFHNDREIGVVRHVFAADAERALESFRDELYSSAFDARRLALD